MSSVIDIWLKLSYGKRNLEWQLREQFYQFVKIVQIPDKKDLHIYYTAVKPQSWFTLLIYKCHNSSAMFM